MIADGAGFNTWKATAMFRGTSGKEFHDAPGWTKLAVSTRGVRLGWERSVSSTGWRLRVQDLEYDPLQAWAREPIPGGDGRHPYHFSGYRWLREEASDSANTITAIVTGHRTYLGAINVDGSREPIRETLAHLAHESGRRVGTVTSMPFTDATAAAAAGAHHETRDAYCELAVEILTGPYPDFIAGCGNPDFDNNGKAIEDTGLKDYRYVGGSEIWAHLTGAARLEPGREVCPTESRNTRIELDGEQIAALDRWALVQSTTEIESLALTPSAGKKLILPRIGQVRLWRGVAGGSPESGTVTVGSTLQQKRGSRADPRYTAPGYDQPVPGVPSLELLTRAALRALEGDEPGFFLHVEGGAVDDAMHDKQIGRMVEEMTDFQRSIEAVLAWVDDHGGWDETLVIVTADHDHLLWGPNSTTEAFDPLQDRGPGRLPAYRWLYDRHSNALVPLFARGPGAARLQTRVRGQDPVQGAYIHQTDIFLVMRAALLGGQ